MLAIAATLLPASATAQYIETIQAQKDANKCIGLHDEFATYGQSGRLFNFGWRFSMGNPEGAERTDFDDSAWRTLDLPHDFQFEMPWDSLASRARGFKQMGDAWYRKTFVPDTLWRGHRVLLDFGGIMYYGDVWLNGTKVASTEYGYLGFEADITRHLRYGQDNVIAVYASTGDVNGSRWYTGGGLYRDVRIRIQNPTHIARHGVYVTTPKVSANGATVSVQVEVDGWQKASVETAGGTTEPAVITIETEIWDNERCVGRTSSAMPDHTIQRCTEVTLPHVSVSSPHLWSPDTPYLYNARVAVKANGLTIDTASVDFGIRQLEYSPEFGFRLNGSKLFVKGIANHHDMGALGAASYDRAIERMMLRLKEFGFNAIRCSHNPYSESFTRIADRVGLLVVDELIDKWSDTDYWGGRKPFMSLWPELITEWVKRDRNSPSVILWSLGNELQTRTEWSGYRTNDWGVTTYRIFDQMVKRYDPTRKTTVAMFPARAGGQRNTPDFWQYLVPPELACATEVASFNYQWKAYAGYYEHKPDLILFQSEAVTSELLAPFYGMDQERGVGLAYWGAIEYWGESNGWPKKGWNFSYFSHTLMPFPQAWLIRSAFKPDEPVVRIGVVENSGELLEWNDIKVGQQVIGENWNRPSPNLFTYTNAEEVELLIDGKSVGIQRNDQTAPAKRNIIYWQGIDTGKGKSVTAIARTGGREVARHELQATGRAVALSIEAETPQSWRGDGMDLQYVTVYAVDSKGRRVPDADCEVTVSVEGEAQLVAVDNGDHYTNDTFLGVSTRRMKNGYLQAIVRSSRNAGKVTIKATSPSVKSSQLKLNTL
ncbi:MAG: DUF4982 domain-containing protein [Bacteroidales bacterium]|nr:DUF4982 domain-containing protein [Candidatus Liminaster caballi]